MQHSVARNPNDDARIDTYTFSEVNGPTEERQAFALLALSHTKIEHQLYEIMLAETRKTGTRAAEFSVRHLMIQSGFHSYSGVRRARSGLMKKMSIDRQTAADNSAPGPVVYFVHTPIEIFARRQEAGLPPYPKELMSPDSEISTSGEIIERLLEKHSLSRREVHVALSCAEGLTNSKIGERLFIHEETVKFHLRNIFIKFGVRRRTELMAYLFMHKRPE